ncbi:MAG: hypothetical protein EOO41_05175, partial [Methanobacteriota archaeon]
MLNPATFGVPLSTALLCAVHDALQQCQARASAQWQASVFAALMTAVDAYLGAPRASVREHQVSSAPPSACPRMAWLAAQTEGGAAQLPTLPSTDQWLCSQVLHLPRADMQAAFRALDELVPVLRDWQLQQPAVTPLMAGAASPSPAHGLLCEALLDDRISLDGVQHALRSVHADARTRTLVGMTFREWHALSFAAKASWCCVAVLDAAEPVTIVQRVDALLACVTVLERAFIRHTQHAGWSVLGTLTHLLLAAHDTRARAMCAHMLWTLLSDPMSAALPPRLPLPVRCFGMAALVSSAVDALPHGTAPIFQQLHQLGEVVQADVRMQRSISATPALATSLRTLLQALREGGVNGVALLFPLQQTAAATAEDAH